MTTEPGTQDERARLIEQAARTVGLPDGTATRDIEDLIDAGWRPPPSGDVIAEAAEWIEEKVHQWQVHWSEFDGQALADSLADEGYLRAPGEQECDGGYACAAPRHIEGCLSGDTPGESVSIPVSPPDEAEMLRQAVGALAELVRLKDGARDEDYRDAKEEAWAHARDVINEPWALRAAGEGQQ